MQIGFGIWLGLVWFGEKIHLMRWIVIDLFVHWAKESNVKQTGLVSRSKSQIFFGKDRQVIEDLGRLIGEVV